MTTKITLSTIVAYLKSKEELPKLLEIKHYAKILQNNGEYKKINHSLNALSKALGYRKFGDLKNKLKDTGSIVNFRFEINENPTLEMPYTLTLNCECFVNETYQNIYSNLEMQPWVIVSEDGIKIQYTEELVLDLLYIDLEYTPKEGVFFNEHEVIEFEESMIPTSIGDLFKALNDNYEARIKEEINPSIDKNENGGFLKHMSNLILVKPLSKTRYAGGIMISDYINKDLTIDMDITFGNFNTDIEAEIYANAAKAVFKNDGSNSKVEISSKGKTWIIADDNIVFKRLKKEKAKLLGRPLNPSVSEDFEIIKDSLNENSPYHAMYNIDSESDLEIIDYSLSELSKHLKDGFDFQVLAYYSEEIKKKRALKYNNFSESEIFFNGIKEIFDNEKSLNKYTFEELSDDVYVNDSKKTKDLNLTFYDSEQQYYNRLVELVNKKFKKMYKYNVVLTHIDSHKYMSVCFEYCEPQKKYSRSVISNFIKIKDRYIYRFDTGIKDKNGRKIRFADRVSDSKGNTYLVDKNPDSEEYWLSCNEDLNIIYDLKDFEGELSIIVKNTTTINKVTVCSLLIDVINQNDIDGFKEIHSKDDLNSLIIDDAWTLGVAQSLCNSSDDFFEAVFKEIDDYILNAEYMEQFVDEVNNVKKAKILLNYINDDKNLFAESLAASAIFKYKVELIKYISSHRNIDLKKLLLDSLSSLTNEEQLIKSINLFKELQIIDEEFIYNQIIPTLKKWEDVHECESKVKEHYTKLNELKKEMGSIDKEVL